MSGWLRYFPPLGVLGIVLVLLSGASQLREQFFERQDLASSRQAHRKLKAGLQNADVHRAVGLLQYVIGDYPEAVDTEGHLLSQDEFEEQVEILEEVEEILTSVVLPARLHGSGAHVSKRVLLRRVESIQKAIQECEAPSKVCRLTAGLRSKLIESFSLQCAPRTPLNLQEGQQLYRISCAACHGLDGRSQTVVARDMVPRPADFLAPARKASMTAYQVFNVSSFGVPETAMPAYETLTPAERWNIAYYVMALRHREENHSSSVTSAAMTPLIDAARLSTLTDADVLKKLALHGVPAAKRSDYLGQLRRAPRWSPPTSARP